MVSVLDPLEVKGLRFRNRIVMPPMQTSLATREGVATDELIDYYVQRTKDLGLLIVEHSYVSLEGKVSEKQLGIYDDKLIDGLSKLASRVHQKATPIIVQLNHGGQKARKKITGFDAVAPSPTGTARELQVEELEDLAKAYASAAQRAMKAGFDGVEIHGAHGFLLNQFYSPLTNHRTDNYGGSFKKRIRFPLEVIKNVKETIGGRLLLYRLGSVDLEPSGITIADSKRFARKLEAHGVDMVDVSGGLCGYRPVQLQGTQGFFIPQAQQIREVVNIPIIGVGGIIDPDYADTVIRENRVDLVAVGRKLRNNPDWVVQAINVLKTNPKN